MKIFSVLALTLLASSTAAAAELNAADTAWMLVASSLVLLMTPAGLALFYGGMTQRKSVLNTVGMSYTACCVATLAWFAYGYTIAFGGGGRWLGGFDFLFLRGIAIDELHGGIPLLLFVAFQGTFAAITVAIISGSIIERVRYSTWLLFTLIWVGVCYAPIAHWVWGGGLLSGSGELDFAGGTVVHLNAGAAGLTLALMLGKREAQRAKYAPSSVKMTMLGSALLWFGWFGFNAGSQLAADFIAANAWVVTNVAAAAGGIAWLLVDWVRRVNRSLIGTASGVVAGLVGITPASGYVTAFDALWIGALSGLVGYFAVFYVKKVFNYDDALDAFGLHGAVGIFGALATGFFANPLVNPDAAGLLYGNPGQVGVQVFAVAVVLVYSVAATAVTFKITCWLTGGGRISGEQERRGMDSAYHGEEGYSWDATAVAKKPQDSEN